VFEIQLVPILPLLVHPSQGWEALLTNAAPLMPMSPACGESWVVPRDGKLGNQEIGAWKRAPNSEPDRSGSEC